VRGRSAVRYLFVGILSAPGCGAHGLSISETPAEFPFRYLSVSMPYQDTPKGNLARVNEVFSSLSRKLYTAGRKR
jgi:hypothetical protein